MLKKILDKSKLISLDEESHTYTLLNSTIEFKSVTEFIHTFFKPFDEKKIAKKLTQTNLKYKGMSVEELIGSWNKRRDRGTIVHKQIEDYINSNFIISELEFNNLDPKTQQGINFIKKKCLKKTNKLFSEVMIYSEELKLAGTIDLIVYNEEKNHISLIDWKTNKRINKSSFNNQKGTKFPLNNMDDCNFTHYNLQLSMYQYILEKYYNVNVNGLFLVHLNEQDYNYKNYMCDYKKNMITQMINELLNIK